MGDPVYPMGVGYGGGMYSKPSQQDLLSDHRKYDTKNEMAAIELSKGSAVYNPPEPPSASTTQYSANSQLSRDKSVKDRYKQRKAGGDSGMGECSVLVGTALGIYFNWDKIRDAISHTGNSTAPSDTQSAAIAAPTATAAPPAARDLLHLAGSLVSPLVENDVLPALL
ncbi:hypothetical protein EV178_000460 [Coemansia sp. RSA 1646]|nr:hypothetical protein EV178_000460 [Coemansia sp. RSA 1646]